MKLLVLIFFMFLCSHWILHREISIPQLFWAVVLQRTIRTYKIGFLADKVWTWGAYTPTSKHKKIAGLTRQHNTAFVVNVKVVSVWNSEIIPLLMKHQYHDWTATISVRLLSQYW